MNRVQSISHRFSVYVSFLRNIIGANAKNPSILRSTGFSNRSLAVSYSRMATATLPSPQLRFTTEFEMDSGGTTALLPPDKSVIAYLTMESFLTDVSVK